MQLVILAAGRGMRLGENNSPKCLIQLWQKPYLELQFNGFEKYSFSEKIVVGGFGIRHLRDFISKNYHSGYVLVENPDFHKGNLYSLKSAQKRLNEDFFIFNADHYYSQRNYLKILSFSSEHITVFCDHDRCLGVDDMKIQVATDGKFSANQHSFLQSMSKDMVAYDAGYVGVTYVPQSAYDVYWEALSQAEFDFGDQANVEHILNVLAKSGEKIIVRDISGSWWTEIDTPQDFHKAKETIKRYSTDIF